METKKPTEKETTTVKEVEFNLDEFLSPTGEDVLVPKEENKNFFKRDAIDLSFLDKELENKASNKTIETEPNNIGKTEKASDVIDKIVEEGLSDLSDLLDEASNTKGRTKIDKNGLIELTTKLIEKKALIPFDDDKPLSEYSIADFEELLESNMQERERKIREQTPIDFFDSLPQEMQYAASYIANGGQDLKGLFRMLAQSEEVKSLDVKNESDQEVIVRNYLSATNFGTEDEIQEEIDAWRDRGELESKANKFKPKLDSMQEQVIASNLEKQALKQKQQQEQANKYMQNVYKTLEPGEINGIKLPNKVRDMLYAGLVQPSYNSINGKQTNLLGHLLEKHQFVEPNHELIAEALWLLADPKGYREEVKNSVNKEVVEKTIRQLKTAEKDKKQSSIINDEEDERKAENRLPRPSKNFFKRQI